MDNTASSLSTTSTMLHDKSWGPIHQNPSPEGLHNYASSTSSSRSDIDSLESHSTYLESPFDDTPLDSPFPEIQASPAKVNRDDPPVVAVLGVGYVGLHLVEAFSRHYKVIAFDVNQKRLDTVAVQLSDVTNISFTNDPSSLSNATHFLVAVPTPLHPHTTTINTSIIRSALKTVCDHVRVGATVVIESSVSVGMTRSLLSEVVQTHGIYAGMSPEVSATKRNSCNVNQCPSASIPVELIHHTRTSLKSSLDWTM